MIMNLLISSFFVRVRILISKMKPFKIEFLMALCHFKTDIDVMKCLDIKKSKEQMKCTIVWNRPSLPEVVPL